MCLASLQRKRLVGWFCQDDDDHDDDHDGYDDGYDDDDDIYMMYMAFQPRTWTVGMFSHLNQLMMLFVRRHCR